jgi:hypothetical protein
MDKDELNSYLGKAYKLSGIDNSPLLFVVEVSGQEIDRNICNETTGFLKFDKDYPVIKFKMLWFHISNKSTGFQEAVFFEDELEEFEGEIPYLFSDFDSYEEKFGMTVSFPFVLQKPSKLEMKSLKMVLVDVLKNKELSKFGNPNIIRPEYLLKCKWYNELSGKFEETILPRELFIKPLEEEE